LEQYECRCLRCPNITENRGVRIFNTQAAFGRTVKLSYSDLKRKSQKLYKIVELPLDCKLCLQMHICLQFGPELRGWRADREHEVGLRIRISDFELLELPRLMPYPVWRFELRIRNDALFYEQLCERIRLGETADEKPF